MNIVVHDYSGHPFQVQLSRELARRGHSVTHLYSQDFQTPKGDLKRRHDDPPGFNVVGITLGTEFLKTSLIRRRQQEIAYGRAVSRRIAALKPNVVISSNAPLDAQRFILQTANALTRCAFIFWIQDLYGEAICRILSKKMGRFGWLIGRQYKRLEGRLLRQSNHVVAITGDFLPELGRSGIDLTRVDVVENWACLDTVPGSAEALPRSEHAARLNIVYAGTLGYKHNPNLLAMLASSFDVDVNVFSEGAAADGLEKKAGEDGLTGLRIQPWVDFSKLPVVLSEADILVALIDADAGAYSVPSKILTYMSTGRPILASIPKENLAARIIEREGAGLVAAPGDAAEFIAHAKRLVGDAELRKKMGAAARAYAIKNFQIARIGDRFEDIIQRALSTKARQDTFEDRFVPTTQRPAFPSHAGIWGE